MARREELTDEQRALIEPLMPEPPRREGGRGRPWRDTREAMNGVLRILGSGARWQDSPNRFPPYQTCRRGFQPWVREGTLRKVLEALAQDLKARGDLDLSECFIGRREPARLRPPLPPRLVRLAGGSAAAAGLLSPPARGGAGRAAP